MGEETIPAAPNQTAVQAASIMHSPSFAKTPDVRAAIKRPARTGLFAWTPERMDFKSNNYY
jgi:hypothetical protein